MITYCSTKVCLSSSLTISVFKIIIFVNYYKLFLLLPWYYYDDDDGNNGMLLHQLYSPLCNYNNMIETYCIIIQN